MASTFEIMYKGEEEQVESSLVLEVDVISTELAVELTLVEGEVGIDRVELRCGVSLLLLESSNLGFDSSNDVVLGHDHKNFAYLESSLIFDGQFDFLLSVIEIRHLLLLELNHVMGH